MNLDSPKKLLLLFTEPLKASMMLQLPGLVLL